MMDRISVACVAIGVLLLHGCATGPAPRIDYDSEQDFSNYQSFTWFSENPMKLGETANPPSGSLQRDIMAAIRSVLEADAYRFADATASADFLVSFTVGSRESSKPDSQAEREPGASGRGGWGTAYYGGASESYLQGILVIDFYDAAERRPVWHGASTTKITEQDRENMPQVINAIVDTILSEFPPN